jgi:DNA-binding response OmpR family regulator
MGDDESGGHRAGDAPVVLAVDDEPDVTEVYSLWLPDEYTVHRAAGGEEALEVMDETVDVVLLDRLMPGTNGDAVLEHIREEGYDCRVAMVTAVDPDFDVLEMPFDDYVVKPVDPDELRATVDRLLTLAAYDARSEALFRLAARRAALESAKSEETLAANDEYRALVERIDELRAELDDVVDDLDGEAFDALLRDL